MKALSFVYLFVLLLAASSGRTTSAAVLGGWNFGGLPGGPNQFGDSPLPATTFADHLSVGGLARGSGIATTGTGAARAWGGNDWTAADADAAIAAGDFVTCSIAADPSFSVSFTSISRFDYRRSGSGPDRGLIQYQVGSDAFSDLATLDYSASTSGGASLPPLDLAGIPALQNVAASTTVTFRIVNFRVASGASPNGTWYLFDVANSEANDFEITGTVHTSTSQAPSVTLSVDPQSGTEAAQTVITVTATASAPVSGDQTVTVTVSGIGITSEDFSLSSPTITIPSGQTSASVIFTVMDDEVLEGDEAAVLTLASPSAGIGLGTITTRIVPIADNDASVDLIHDIQGSGATFHPAFSGTRTVEGIVIASFPGNSGLLGFFVQEEDADSDADPETPEGLFVFDPSGLFTGAVGDKVRVTGVVGEFTSSSANIAGTGVSSLTQITAAVVLNLGASTLPAVASVVLPVPDLAFLERYEGMRVNVRAASGPLVVTETFKLGRFGQVGLSGGARIDQFTQVNPPSIAGYSNHLANLQNNYILLDDGSTRQNPDPVIFARNGQPLSAANPLRGGDSVFSVEGVLDHRFEGYRVQTQSPVNFLPGNPRPSTPPQVGGHLRVASANLLNFFNGPAFPTPRGAHSPAEFARQMSKTVSMVLGLDADIFGYNELENDGFGPGSAVQTLVDALNAATAPGTYAFVTPPASILTSAGGLGGDEITVGFLFKPASVRIMPGTQPAALQSGIFAQDPVNRAQRPPFAVTFEQLSSGTPTGEALTVVVNHFKSKGSAAQQPGDVDSGDGQGFSNATRLLAAQELIAWLATQPTGTTDPDLLILGDLNAYRMEDPIVALTSAGYVSLFGPESYSFQFNGQWGSLDHALVNGSLAGHVTGAGKWHINSDEPVVFDYNTEFKSPGQITGYYTPDALRSSDHDPVLIGLQLLNQPPVAPDQTFARGANRTLEIPIADLLAAGSDPEGGPVTLDALGPSSRGATILRSPTHLLYSLNSNEDDEFSYTLADGQGGRSSGRLLVRVISPGGFAQSVRFTGGPAVLTFAGIPGVSHDIQRATSVEGPWITVGPAFVPPVSGLFEFTDANPPQPAGYYRLLQAGGN